MVRPSLCGFHICGKNFQFPLPYSAAILCRASVLSVSEVTKIEIILYQLGNLRQVSVPNILLIMLLQLLVAVACFAHFATTRQVSLSFYHAQI